jgi:uncharacterized membrane protein YraQ (UPF0718 family)
MDKLTSSKKSGGDDPKRDFGWTNLILAAVAITLAGIAWHQGGFARFLAGIISGANTFWSVTLLLIAAFLIAGLTQALVSREAIDRWLGARSGWRGILLGCLGGALIPGGPYVYYPIAGALLQAGAGLGVLVAFVSAKNMWSFSRLPLEIALLGFRLTAIRYSLTLLVPPLLGLLAEFLFKRYLKSIREAVQ